MAALLRLREPSMEQSACLSRFKALSVRAA